MVMVVVTNQLWWGRKQPQIGRIPSIQTTLEFLVEKPFSGSPYLKYGLFLSVCQFLQVPYSVGFLGGGRNITYQ